MSVAVAEEPRVLHTVPGRVRVHVPGWSGQGKRSLETQLREVQGVRSVQANALTGNILLQFDPTVTNEQTVLALVKSLVKDVSSEPENEPALPPVVREKHGRATRARIAVRGLNRDPDLAKQVVEALERHPGVRASASLLTGRVLVEFTEHRVDLEDLIAEVADLELSTRSGTIATKRDQAQWGYAGSRAVDDTPTSPDSRASSWRSYSVANREYTRDFAGYSPCSLWST